MRLLRVLKYIFEVFSHIQKPRDNCVFFQSFGGQYNDNPRAVSVKLHELFPSFKQFWAISAKSKRNDIPDYVRIVKFDSFKSIWIRNRCKYVVENGVGVFLFYDPNPKTIKLILINRRQFDIATWHGYPIKSIGRNIPENRNWTFDTVHSSSNIVLSGSKRFSQIFADGFLNKLNLLETGCPRNDILFLRNEGTSACFRKKLGMPDKKLILYVPTFRFDVGNSGINQINSIDFDALYSALHHRFGGDWVLVFRAHNKVFGEIEKQFGGLLAKQMFLMGNEFDDMAEYLYVADAVITDYSGCIFDIMLTDKPCFLFALDRQHYKEKERGLDTDLSTLPYRFSDSFDELLSDINTYDSDSVNKKRIEFLSSIGNCEDGHASERVVDIIVHNTDYMEYAKN